jgi:MFS family permease
MERKRRAVASRTSEPESVYAWWRLAASMALATIGGVGMWCVVVALPEVQAEFGGTRADASLAYTFTMVGFAVGGVLAGWLADRFRITLPLMAGAVALGLGFVVSGFTASLWQFALAQGLLVGIGTSVTFGPLIADVSLWFTKRRGIAVAICASGNYLAGTIWPPLVQHFMQTQGWRDTYIVIGVFCAVTMVPLALALRRRPPVQHPAPAQARSTHLFGSGSLGLSPNTLMILLAVAGVGCCVAMSMPQVHIVAYCVDLGYGPARGSQMLALMLGFGIVSRLASGWICDRVGGLRTLLLGSALQGVALLLFLPFKGVLSLYTISILFGLFQGGIVPSYAIIVREHFPAREAGARVGAVIMCTMVGMALGGWMSGRIFDLTGSYRAAFVNGLAWNAVNLGIVLLLLRGTGALRGFSRRGA